MEKIVFLDIDGVLNVCYNKERDEYGQGFHPEFVENLRKLIFFTDAKIVISSSWRKSGLKEMQAMWKHRNLPGEVIDTTASLYLKKGGCIQFWNDKLMQHPTPEISGYSIPRGCEIDYWLRDKGYYRIEWSDEEQKKVIERSGISSYVILDDDSDMLYGQHNHFVRTSRNHDHTDHVEGYGLTAECTAQAIAILTGINKKTAL